MDELTRNRSEATTHPELTQIQEFNADWHYEKRHQQVPNRHVYDQKVERGFHVATRGHYVDYNDVAKETEEEDHRVCNCHLHCCCKGVAGY